MKVAVTLLVSSVAALLALGMVMLYSSSMAEFGARYLVKQLVGCAVGIGLCVTAAALDYRSLKKFAWPLFALAVLLLVLVFVPHIGIRRHGASRWLGYGRTSFFQPSEFAKLALLIALAWYCERFQRQMPTLKRGLLVPALFIGVVLGLILKEPDVGTMLLVAAVSSAMLLIAGIRLRYFLPPVIAGALALGVFIYYNLVELTAMHQRGQHGAMRSERIYSWLHLEETKQDKGLQAYEAMIALGSGGLIGKGLGDGRQKLGFVPEHRTDFIFSIIGEELGLSATLLVIAAFVTLLVCGIYIAWNSHDAFGLLLGSGITFLIGLQALINIGVVTSALPNKGLPLPFISYGGSNLAMMLLSVGILLSIARHGRPADAMAELLSHGEDFRDPNPFKARNPK
jgi:cell division protein FtsW